jgi:hypothetical protein
MIGVLSGGIEGDELLSAPTAQVYDDARTLTPRRGARLTSLRQA